MYVDIYVDRNTSEVKRKTLTDAAAAGKLNQWIAGKYRKMTN